MKWRSTRHPLLLFPKSNSMLFRFSWLSQPSTSAPVGGYKPPLFMGFVVCQLVQDLGHQRKQNVKTHLHQQMITALQIYPSIGRKRPCLLASSHMSPHPVQPHPSACKPTWSVDKASPTTGSNAASFGCHKPTQLHNVETKPSSTPRWERI